MALDVEDWQPNQKLSIDGNTPGLMAFPKPLNELPIKGIHAQAVARFNALSRVAAKGAGNGCSEVQLCTNREPVRLVIDRTIEAQPFPETDYRRLLEVNSELLSKFHHRDVIMRAGVLLPPSYATSPERRFPVIVSVPGFSGTHFEVARWKQSSLVAANGTEFILVIPDPSCPLGHHCFADSANNGPWGTAFVEEFIPQLDKTFRTDARPAARFLTGHSSGGWSSLWLQVTYPNDFGGTWSTSPDPVTFVDFQRINLYADRNMYWDAQPQRRPLARRQGQPFLWYEDFARYEHLLGYGEQLHSFEAVFSPAVSVDAPFDPAVVQNSIPAPNPTRPQPLWNWTTGDIDHNVAQAWKKYDIVHMLESNEDLRRQLRGKLTVIMGEADTFYLEGATRILQESMRRLNSDARIELIPDKTHFDLLDGAMRSRIISEMAAKYQSQQSSIPDSSSN
ncbi:MAG: alpha/beta hydrolase [Planctomycetaceae bacterium]